MLCADSNIIMNTATEKGRVESTDPDCLDIYMYNKSMVYSTPDTSTKITSRVKIRTILATVTVYLIMLLKYVTSHGKTYMYTCLTTFRETDFLHGSLTDCLRLEKSSEQVALRN